MILEMLVPFILTFGLECIILNVLVREDPTRTALYAFLINALTWPIAPFAFSYVLVCLPALSSMILIQVGAVSVSLALSSLIAIEVGVVFAEAALMSLLFEIGRKKSLAVSGLANFLSAIISPLLFLMFA